MDADDFVCDEAAWLIPQCAGGMSLHGEKRTLQHAALNV
jgi:hypothetical protein